MTAQTRRRFTAFRRSTARALRAVLPVVLLVALGGDRAIGQVPPTFSVNDVTVTEGQSGLTMVEFTVSLANGNGTESSVGFTTNDGTATGGGLSKPVPSAGPITLGDGPSSPYGIPFNVSGVTGPLVSLSLLFESLQHPSPRDLDMLLVAPGGQDMVVQSDTGPATNPNTISYILRDYNPFIGNSFLGGSYGPTSRSPADVFPAPAPPGPHVEAPPDGTATMTDTFLGIDPNGTWRVFINDDAGGSTGNLNRIVLAVDTPEPGTDFSHVGGRLTFPPGGATTQKVRAWVNGDTITEADETFALDLASPVNGVIGDGQGIATIRNGGGGLPPTTVNDAYQTAVDTPLLVPAPGVLANDNTNLGGAMSAQLVTAPSFGLLTLATDGSFKYIPGPNFAGTDSFTYRAENTAGQGNVATVQITVAAGVPTAVDDAYEYPNAVDGGFFGAGPGVLLRNDDDNGGGPMSAELVSGPASGQLNFDATGRFLYRPANGFAGTATFTYRLTNQFGASNIATVSIAITRGTRPPAPANLRVDSIVGNRPLLRFDAHLVSPAPTGYEIAGGTQPGQTIAVASTGSLYPIFRFPFDAPFGSFVLRAHSVLGNERSTPSNEVSLHMNATVTPSAPANLLGSMDGANLTLAWKNTFSGGIPTNTFLRVTGGASVTVPLGQTETLSFSPVPPGIYTFEVFNGNTGGVSAVSNAVTLASPGACSAPQIPEDFLLYVNGLVLGAIWDLPASGPAPTSYLLHVTSPVFTGSVPLNGRNIEAQVPPGTYTASVEATTACGSSARTPEQTVVVQ